jgi:hypothetical protein
MVNIGYVVVHIMNLVACGGVLALIIMLGVILYRQGRAAAGEASGESGQDSYLEWMRRAKIPIGLGVAWATLYPLLFFGVYFIAFFSAFFIAAGGRPPGLPLEGFPFMFFAFFPLHIVTIFILLVLQVLFLIHVIKNTQASEVARIVLGVGIFVMPFIAVPVYYILYIFLDRPPDWARLAADTQPA